jgi:hypothetical protein
MKPVCLGLLAAYGIGNLLSAQQDVKKSAQQDVKKLTARELFYAAVDTPSPARKPTKAAARPKPVRKRATPSDETEADKPPVPVTTVAYKPQSALGLRYTILKRSGEGQTEADADTVFRAGDRIRLAVETNDDGYLYVVTRGSSGTWKLLFPSSEIKEGDNRIQRYTRYEIPSGYTFTFDEQAGEEKLFIVLSRQPEPDLEGLIYSLGQNSSAPAETQKAKMLLASAAFSDAVIGKLRNAYARDLIVEKVDDEQAGPKKEKAIYAVNPSGTVDSRVVADVRLKHQ